MTVGLSGEKKDIRSYITDIYISLMLLIFPLFVGFEGYANLTFSKYLFFVIITLIWLVSLVFFSLKGGWILPHNRRTSLFSLLFMLVCTVSALLSDHFPETIIGAGRYDGLVTQLLYAFIFLGVSTFAKPKQLHFAMLGISSSLCCIIAVFQLFDVNIFRLFPNDYSYYDAHIKYSGEFLGTLGNVDILTGYLCMCVPVFFAAGLQAKRPAEYLYVIPLFLSALILSASSTAGGMVALCGWIVICIPAMCTDLAKLHRVALLLPAILLALALSFSFDSGVTEGGFYFDFSLSLPAAAALILAALCFVFALIIKPFCRKSNASPRAVIYLLAACAVMASLIYIWGYNGTEGTIYEFSQVLHGNIDDSFGSSRVLIWRSILETVGDNLLFGAGPDTLPLYIDIDFSRYVPQTGETLSTYVDNAHNVYLGYLAGIGICGLVCYILLIASCLISQNKHPNFAPALAGAAAAYLIYSFFGLGLCLIAPVFWIFSGLIASPNNNNTILEE